MFMPKRCVEVYKNERLKTRVPYVGCQHPFIMDHIKVLQPDQKSSQSKVVTQV